MPKKTLPTLPFPPPLPEKVAAAPLLPSPTSVIVDPPLEAVCKEATLSPPTVVESQKSEEVTLNTELEETEDLEEEEPPLYEEVTPSPPTVEESQSEEVTQINTEQLEESEDAAKIVKEEEDTSGHILVMWADLACKLPIVHGKLDASDLDSELCLSSVYPGCEIELSKKAPYSSPHKRDGAPSIDMRTADFSCCLGKDAYGIFFGLVPGTTYYALVREITPPEVALEMEGHSPP